MRRIAGVLSACVLVAVVVVPVASPSAAAPTSVAYSYAGTATATCTLDVGGGCLPGTTTHTTLMGSASGCIGDGCATVPSSATVEVAYDFVGLPPNPCKARGVAGALTLTPTDPAFPPDPVIVSVRGRLHGHDGMVLEGTIPAGTAFPTEPIRVAVTLSHPPNPCTPDAGIFSVVFTLG